MPQLRIDVWSDIACPWCYIGKRRLERALADFPHAADVVVTWRAFELDPGAPPAVTGGPDLLDKLATKLGATREQAQVMVDRVTQTAASDGITMHMATVQSGNTFDAHRLVHLGTERGLGTAVKERLFRAYFTEGQRVSDRETLAGLAVEAGLDEHEAREVLATARFAEDVRRDEATAREVGIRGVPCFVLDQRLAVSGAQPSAVLRSAIEQAWAELVAGESAAPPSAAPASELR